MTQGTINKDELGHNGWTNYETWAVNLWLDNDEHTQQMVYRLANGRLDRASAREALKDFVENEREEWRESGASMFDDLLNGALSSVDYWEIIAAAAEDDEDA